MFYYFQCYIFEILYITFSMWSQTFGLHHMKTWLQRTKIQGKSSKDFTGRRWSNERFSDWEIRMRHGQEHLLLPLLHPSLNTTTTKTTVPQSVDHCLNQKISPVWAEKPETYDSISVEEAPAVTSTFTKAQNSALKQLRQIVADWGRLWIGGFLLNVRQNHHN